MFSAVVGIERTLTRATAQLISHDCVLLIVVRDGSMIMSFEGTAIPVGVGQALLIAPCTQLTYEPEGQATVVVLCVDTDYLIEHLFWQHLDLIPDRDAARELAAKLYPDPVQVLRLGEREIERLGPVLDELVALTATSPSAAGYFHVHRLLFAALEAITPHVHHATVEIPSPTSRERAARVAAPRWQSFRPVRQEAARVAALMHDDITQSWRLDRLAEHACLSTSQLTRIFKESFGVTPLVYLSMLRVQEMARLIRETDLLITVITERVGWCYHSGCATRAFRRYMGVTPIRYRHYGPPTASRDGPGIGVARAARAARSER